MATRIKHPLLDLLCDALICAEGAKQMHHEFLMHDDWKENLDAETIQGVFDMEAHFEKTAERLREAIDSWKPLPSKSGENV